MFRFACVMFVHVLYCVVCCVFGLSCFACGVLVQCVCVTCVVCDCLFLCVVVGVCAYVFSVPF